MNSGFDLERLNRVVDLCERYVDEGKLPCAQVQVALEGDVVLRHTTGMADIESNKPLGDDSIFRIYSMTKPITSIALLGPPQTPIIKNMGIKPASKNK